MKLVILDRDGVINVDSDAFIKSPDEWVALPGALEAIARLNQAGYRVAIATNQSGIGRGLFTEADFRTLMDYMSAEFRRHGVPIAAIYHAPEHPTEGVGRYRRDSPWRKPHPGMILAAQHDLGLDLSRSWGIGDETRDIVACRDAGVATLVLLDDSAAAPAKKDGVWVMPRLADVLALAEGEKTA